MKKCILTLFATFSLLVLHAQDTLITPADTAWKSGGNIGLNFNQNYFSNWVAGGNNSIGVTGNVNLFANYRLGEHNWENAMLLAYGIQKIGDGDFFKTDDKIDITSRYGYSLTPNWQASAMLNFRSQFTPGYQMVDNVEIKDNVVSDFLAPGYVLFAPGLTYQPEDYFNVVISPATLKMTIVTIDSLATTYGLDPGENIRAEFGAYLRLTFKKDIGTNVNYATTLDLFSNYQDNPQNIDVNWDNVLTFKINRLLNASLLWQVLYDDDIEVSRLPEELDENGNNLNVGPATQLRQVFSLGFGYKFGSIE